MTLQCDIDGLRANKGHWDALVIGGGFFGCVIATLLKQDYGLDRVLVVEREKDLMLRASFANQARVHSGYHYPRSFTTAFRSRVNFPRFIARYRDCVVDDFTMLYCIAAQNSLVTKYQFEKFCRDIGADIRLAGEDHSDLFNPVLIDAVYQVEEFAFDSTRLAQRMRQDMEAAGVSLSLETNVDAVFADPKGPCVSLTKEGETVTLSAGKVFNCTYGGLNALLPRSGAGTGSFGIKYEIAEIALMEMPKELAKLGVTVMDGPFFSCMPFPATGHHSLTHVRYTPHYSWIDEDEQSAHPYDVLDGEPLKSRVRYMIGDAARYLPAIRKAKHSRSLYEVKAVLLTNELDDGRPILFHRHENTPGLFSVLGGKIDNVYDVAEAMQEALAGTRRTALAKGIDNPTGFTPDA